MAIKYIYVYIIKKDFNQNFDQKVIIKIYQLIR